MKKMIIAAFAVASAAIAQAAAVDWSSGSSYLVDATGTKQTALESGSIVLVVLGSQTGWTDGTWSAKKGTLTELQTGEIVNSGKASAKGKVNMSYAFEYDSAIIKNGDVLAVVFKDADGAYTQLAYYDAKAEGGVGAAVTDTFTVSGMENGLYSGSMSFATQGNFMAVPEPTSGLLMLVGLAGLALRRRRA